MICVNKVKVTYRFITNNAKGSRFAWKLACRSFEVAPRRLVSHWSIRCATQQAWLSNIRRCIAPYDLNTIPPAWLCRKIYYAFRQQIPPTSISSCHKRFSHSLVFISFSSVRKKSEQWTFGFWSSPLSQQVRLWVTHYLFFLCDYNLINPFCILLLYGYWHEKN